MQTQVLSSGEKLININTPVDLVRITSDHHLPPETMIVLTSHMLNGTSPTNNGQRQAYRDRFIMDLLRPKNGIHHVLGGDFMHTYPLIKGRISGVKLAWDGFTQTIERNDITGQGLTLILGNHTSIDSIPDRSKEQLINREILILEGKVRVEIDNDQDPTVMHIRHGHEFDPANRLIFRDSAIAQILMESATRTGLRILSSRPFGNAMRALSYIVNGPQMVNAEKGLNNGEWAIDGHTHMPALHPPNLNQQGPELNLLSYDYLERLVMDSELSKLVLKIVAKVIPRLSGVNNLYATSHNGTGYANSGRYERIAQMLYGLDIDMEMISLILADVNGGYEPDMLNQRKHKSIKTIQSFDLVKGKEPLVEN